MFYDSVYEQITGIGASNLALTGVSKPSYRSTLAAAASGSTIFYQIRHPENEPSTGITEWEFGVGVITESSPGSMTGTLSRDTVLSSSNAGNRVNFTAGTKELTCYPSAAFLNSIGALPQPLGHSDRPTFAGLDLIQTSNSDVLFQVTRNMSSGSAARSTWQLTNATETADLRMTVMSHLDPTYPDGIFIYSEQDYTPINFGIFGKNVKLRVGEHGDVLIGSVASPSANSGKVLVFGDNAADPTFAAGTAGIWNKAGKLYVGLPSLTPVCLTDMQPLGTGASPTFLSLRVGTTNDPPADYSVIMGQWGLDHGIKRALIHSGGHINQYADAQSGEYITFGTTTNLTPKPLVMDDNEPGATNQLVIPQAGTWLVRAMVIARRSDIYTSLHDAAAFVLTCVVARNVLESSTVLIGDVTKEIIYRPGGGGGGDPVPGWDATFFVDTTYGALQVVVTGINAMELKWVAQIKTVETGH